MNANDLIDSYIADVAMRLPRKQRNDVAFELRALLNEGMQARAEAAGRSVDAAMATEFLRAFGHPAEVAARYRPTLAIVDPAEGHVFLRATVIGLAIIWCLGLLKQLQQPIHSGWDFLGALGQWWGTIVVPSLWWPGVLGVGFGAAAWARRRWPRTAVWKPRAGDRIRGSRASIALGIVGILCGLFVLVDPRWMLDVLWNGRAAPAAYEAFTYTDTFLRWQAPCLFVLVALNVPLLLAVMAKGRWTTALRRMDVGLSLSTCAAMLWTVVDGPVLMATGSDQTARFFMVIIVAFTLISLGVKRYRRVRPSPNPQVQPLR